MSIRISGLVSGLDTDSMIEELVSGYEAKKNQIVKKQKSLEYKQDAWKSLNSDIYSFYTKSLSSMRLEGSYNTKTTTVSDSTKATVTASNSAAYGTMELSITALAKSGYLTGANLSNLYDDTKFTSSSTLSEFGIDGTVTLEINGESVTAESTDTISAFLSNLKAAGISAGFDETNQRFYLSSTESGEENDFSLIAADSDSLTALKAMGLFSVSQKDAEAYAALGEDWATEISNNYAAYTAAVKSGDTETAATYLSELGIDDGSGTGAVRVAGSNAEIWLNGAKYESDTNVFKVGELTITANAVTAADEPVSITTAVDTDAVYNKIKTFLSSYNTLITQLESLYGADDAGDYEPLTDDEESEMTDNQIEKWEKKLTDAALSGDDTLSSVISAIKSVMSKSVSINGTSYTWSNFGIGTLGYFNASEFEKGNYHIDGDADDSYTSGKTDKLKAWIESDPDTVVNFMTQITSNLYSTLTEKMKSTSLSSAYTIYNDKSMKSQYEDYDDEIEDWEEKIEEMTEKYVKQFAAMESALAALQNSSSSLASLLSS